MGWQNPKNEHWRGDIGRLILTDDLSLELESSKPFLSVKNDPVSLSYPWVMKEKTYIKCGMAQHTLGTLVMMKCSMLFITTEKADTLDSVGGNTV